MSSSTVRHAYLDWVRGVAVLIMIEAHVLDAWTQAAERSRPLFGYGIILGGFGAPLFLFLAGLAAVLSAESKIRKTGDVAASWRAVHKRGWQVFGLAFLFRLQSYVLSGGFSLISLLKVDILNVMGPAIAAAALIGRLARTWIVQLVLFAGAAAAVSLLTPIIRESPAVTLLPDPIEWYFRPTAGRTNFTLLPWMGFVFAGAAVGVVLARPRLPDKVKSLHVTLAIIGLCVVWVAHETSLRPSPYPRSEYWTSSPSYFLLRVGLLILLLPIGYAWAHAPWRDKLSAWRPLEDFGRSSLFVYWIHVEMVYGFFSRPLRGALTLERALVAYVLFTAFLLALVRLKNWLIEYRAIYLTDSKSVI